MTPEVALEKREQMIEEGFCVIDDVLTEEFLQEPQRIRTTDGRS